MEIKNLTRRSFVKAALATGALAAVGCGKDDGDTVYIDRDFDVDYTNPPNLAVKYDRIVPATSPHNCGGACNMMAYVKDDVIVGIGVDEEKEDVPIYDSKRNAYVLNDRMDDPRSVPCLRCRAHRSLMYDANRLLYPMIQRGERGDINGFERVSWDDALNYMFDKIKTIRKNYGPGAFMNTQTTGSGGFTTANFTKLTGGIAGHRVNWSFYAMAQTLPFVCGGPTTQQEPSPMNDVITSDYVILWALNPAESVFGQENMWRISQMKEKGCKVKVIDTHISTTANTLFNKNEMPKDMYVIPPGTDTALICGMIHTMFTDNTLYGKLKDLWGASTDAELRENIGKLIYGFFDENATPKKIQGKAYETDFNTYYKVPDGGSWSAYIFGNSDYLVNTRQLNKGKSIYPNHIRYDVWEHSDPRCHPTAETKNWCYGQVVKDADWAAKITGIPAERIKELADIFLSNFVSVLAGFAYNRNTEGDGETWALNMFIALTKCFGGLNDAHLPAALKGKNKCRTFGCRTMRGRYDAPAPGGTGWTDTSGSYTEINSQTDSSLLESNGGYLSPAYGIPNGFMYDVNKISLGATKSTNAQGVTHTVTGNQPTSGASGISCFGLMDAISNTNKPKITDSDGNKVYPSYRNDGQIKNRYCPIKGLFNIAGGHPINQYGDVFKNIDIMLQKDTSGTDAYTKNCHPQKYSLELFVVVDPMFTSSALWADVLLPSAMSFERMEVQNGGPFAGDITTRMSEKVHKPLGDALEERHMVGKFAKLFNKEAEYYNGIVNVVPNKSPDEYTNAAGETYEEIITRNKFNNSSILPKVMNYERFRKRGYITPKMVYDATGSWPGNKVASTQDNPEFLTSIQDSDGVFNRSTATGKYEAYCVSIVDDYCARYNNNVDGTISLVDNGTGNWKITAKSIAAADQGKGMFVYPVPMYVPLPEGIHGNGTEFKYGDTNTNGIAHPDPLNIAKDGYTKYVCTLHPMKRCHSTHSNNPLVTDFYKKDKDGNDTYISYDRSLRDNNADQKKNTQLDGPWHDGVYEPIFTNENTTYTDSNEKVKEGDLVVVESKTGAVKVSVVIDNGIRPNTLLLPQGAWNHVIPSDETVHGRIDVGGNYNSLTSQRSTRISGGPAVSNDVRAKLIKAKK